MKGFSDEERQKIRQELVETGREMFATFGLKKTTIAEITDAVGIAEGTFYRFFDSKDHLYWEVLETERERVEDRYVAAVAAADGPRAEIVSLLRTICDEIETNPLARASIEGDEIDRMIRRMSPEELVEANEKNVAFFHEYIESWQRDGAIRSVDPELVGGMLRAATFITLHEEAVGPRYHQIRDFLIETIADGLLTDKYRRS